MMKTILSILLLLCSAGGFSWGRKAYTFVCLNETAEGMSWAILREMPLKEAARWMDDI